MEISARLLSKVAGLGAAAAHVTWRRLNRGPLRPGWRWSVEVVADYLKALSHRVRAVDLRTQRALWEAHALPSMVADQLHHERVELGGVPAAWITPRNGLEERRILFLHGGGYYFGSSRTHADLLSRIALSARARVLSVEYRLAPEHIFPAALEDAVSAYRALLAEGVSPSRLVVAGDSAGGGLCLALLLSLRDAGVPLPAGAAAICPWVDLSAEGGSLVAHAAYDYASADELATLARGYLGSADLRDARVSPLHGDLRGLPPLLIHAGGAEVLLDQIKAVADRARSQGVDVELRIAPDMFHDWHLFAMLLEESRQAVEEIGVFARRRVPGAR